MGRRSVHHVDRGGHYAGLENRRTSDWRRRSGACDTAADGALLGEALRSGLVDADRLDRHTFDHSDSCSRLREAVVIPSVTDARQEVSQENGGVRGETAKTQSEKIDETAARDHGGTSGPNGDIGPSIVSEQSPQYRALYRCWRQCRLISRLGSRRCDLRRRSNTDR